MARYIDQILQPGETVLYSTNAHWIFHLPGLLCWIAAAALLVASRLTLNDTLVMLCLGAAALAAIVALVLGLRAAFHRWTTETDVTNMRVVHKVGFISRRTFEIALDKVAAVNVTQSVWGRIFNFGDVTVESMGENEERIPTIAAPLAFRNAITTRTQP